MDHVIGRIRKSFTSIIELETLQIHADRAVALPDRSYNNGTTSTLRAHYKDIFSIWRESQCNENFRGLDDRATKGSISKHYLLQCRWFVSRQLHGSPMLTKFIIMVNKKKPWDRIASELTVSPHTS